MIPLWHVMGSSFEASTRRRACIEQVLMQSHIDLCLEIGQSGRPRFAQVARDSIEISNPSALVILGAARKDVVCVEVVGAHVGVRFNWMEPDGFSKTTLKCMRGGKRTRPLHADLLLRTSTWLGKQDKHGLLHIDSLRADALLASNCLCVDVG